MSPAADMDRPDEVDRPSEVDPPGDNDRTAAGDDESHKDRPGAERAQVARPPEERRPDGRPDDVVAALPDPEPEAAGTHRQNRREATEDASTARSELRRPSSVESEVGAPAGPISFVRRREIEAVHQEIELSTGDRTRALVGVRKYRDALFANYFRPRSPFVVTWPDNLYIPADADYRAYWSSPAPDDHR